MYLLLNLKLVRLEVSLFKVMKPDQDAVSSSGQIIRTGRNEVQIQLLGPTKNGEERTGQF
jgi:hypothetical protein